MLQSYFGGQFFALENTGPTSGDSSRPTTAPSYVRSIVVANDSTYVVKGCTDWMHKWIEHRWCLSKGELVKNPDQWKAIDKAMNSCLNDGIDVKFCQMPREWNVADNLAKQGEVKAVQATSSDQQLSWCGEYLVLMDKSLKRSLSI
ncbi:hypothetical protein SEUCBS139899_008055 [Sporothrix eucalyptigena]|uniref:RNase H type-1 domain-containing protein n=1 Tax=Sporothrix eucalyptigena TaxID=1812306 RepID=A0ABP0CRT2_9PEZI